MPEKRRHLFLLRFDRFRMPVAAARPAFSVFPLHSVAAVRPSVLTCFLFFFSYARGRYALIGRFLSLRVLGDPRIT